MILQALLILLSAELIRKGLIRFDIHRRRARRCARAANITIYPLEEVEQVEVEVHVDVGIDQWR